MALKGFQTDQKLWVVVSVLTVEYVPHLPSIFVVYLYCPWFKLLMIYNLVGLVLPKNQNVEHQVNSIHGDCKP